jgi:hypothetical protein
MKQIHDIYIKKSPTADTRSCDVSTVSKEQLKLASEMHIGDVQRALDYFRARLEQAGLDHDFDKLESLDKFYSDFQTSFQQHEWWDNHRAVNRHHLQKPDGIPEDVDLIDVLEMIADCVMAGMARTGEVYNITIDPIVLMAAFTNTVEKVKSKTVIIG